LKLRDFPEYQTEISGIRNGDRNAFFVFLNIVKKKAKNKGKTGLNSDLTCLIPLRIHAFGCIMKPLLLLKKISLR
jgi:hypothetical protein